MSHILYTYNISPISLLIFFVRAVTARLHIPHAEELLNSDSKKRKFLVECESLEPTIEKPWPRFRDFQVVSILNNFLGRYVQTTFNIKCSSITICTTGSPWLSTLLSKWATSENKEAWKTWWVDFGFCPVDKVSLKKQYSGKWMYTHTVRKEVAGEMVETRTNVSRQIYDQLLAQVDHHYHQDWWIHVDDDVFPEKFTTMC